MGSVHNTRLGGWVLLVLVLNLSTQTGVHQAALAVSPAIADTGTSPDGALRCNSTPSLSETASGDAHYVSIFGNDANPGTKDEPWRTIQYAVDSVGPGDVIYVRGGMYYESVRFQRSGQEGSPITLTNYADEVVTINGEGEPALTSYWDGVQYWIIDRLRLESDAEYVIQFSVWKAYWSDHCIIRNNYIRGAVLVSGSYNIFEGNEVDGSRHIGNENGISEETEVSHHNIYRNNHIHDFKSRGMWSMHQTHDSIFEYNHVHHIENGDGWAQGIDLDGFGSVVWRHIIRNNYVHDSGDLGIQIENAFDGVVENNIVHDSRCGISVINYGGEVGDDNPTGTDKRCEVGGESGQYGDTDGDNDCRGDITGNIIRQNLIYDISTHAGIVLYSAGGVRMLGNTIHEIGGAGILLWNCAEYCPQIEIQGNIISQFGAGAINLENVDSLVQDSNNLVYSANGSKEYYIAGTGYGLSQYQTTTGKGEGSIGVSPLLVDPSSHDFHLQPSSPAIDAGVDTGLTADLDGNPRPQGLGYEIGAYEYPELCHVYLPTILAGCGLQCPSD